MSGPKIPARGKAAAAKKKGNDVDPLKIVYVVAAVCVIGLLMAVMPSGEDSVNSTLHNFLADNGVKRYKLAFKTGSNGETYGAATSTVQRGEPLLKFTPETIIDMRSIMEKSSIGQLLQKDNGTLVQQHMKDAELFDGFVNMYVYTMFLIMEKRSGTYSKFAGWISSLPELKNMKGALFWEEERDTCLDAGAAGEAEILRKGARAYVELSKELCAQDESACPGGAPDYDELRWGLGIYLAHNFQDQAIIPGMNFLRFDNTREGAFPQWNEQEGVLDVLAGEVAKKGEEVFCAFARGPSSQITSRGFFDKGSRGIDARLRLPDAAKDELLKRRCNDHFAELMFGANGRPRDALIECIAGMVASNKQRKTIKKWRTDPEHNMIVWGNVTGMAKHALDNYKDYNEEECSQNKDALGAMFHDYVSFTSDILIKNYQYSLENHKKAVEAYQAIYPPTAEAEGQQQEDGANEAEDAPENP